MTRLLPIGLLAGLAACTAPAPPESPEQAGVREADATALLEGTWPAALASDAAAVEAVLGGPGGDGWVALFHGDLAAAERTFRAAVTADPANGTARVGLARVHLARADAYAQAALMHAESARALAAYRAEHRQRVRLGPYERRLSTLVFAPDPAPSDGGGEPAIAGELATSAALDSLTADRCGGQTHPGLPATWASSLGFCAAVLAADLPAARASLPSHAPDLVDPLGSDPETGLRFEAPFYDPLRLQALASLHALEAIDVAGGVTGIRDALLARARPAILLPVPDTALASLGPAVEGATAPTILLRFAGRDLDGAGLLARARADLPGSFSDPSSAGADADLRAVEGLEGRFAEALAAGLASELQAPRLLGDALLRARMDELATSHPMQALRLGRRSLDANPGALGGAADSSRTRVSYRNDRAFLLRLARQLWLAGQPGQALDLVHPLAQEDRALQPVVHYLGQLDAAASVGTAGKASQL